MSAAEAEPPEGEEDPLDGIDAECAFDDLDLNDAIDWQVEP